MESTYTSSPVSSSGQSKNTSVNTNESYKKTNPVLEFFSSAADHIMDASMQLVDTAQDFLSDTGSAIATGAQCAFHETVDWVTDTAVPWMQDAAISFKDALKSSLATVGTFGISLGEGVGEFGEAIVDLLALAGTSLATPTTAIFDLGQGIYGWITGDEWESLTLEMWNGTKGFVSTKYVSGWFDSFYENSIVGQWLKENAYGFDLTRGIGDGIGYVAGVIALTILTFGAAGVATGGTSAVASTSALDMSFIAGGAGIGKGTQNAWSDGADLVEGLVHGFASGFWEGLQFYLGGKISNFEAFGASGHFLPNLGENSAQILNSVSRILLDGMDGGVEGFIQPFLSFLYKDGYYDDSGEYVEFTSEDNLWERYSEMFDDSGGWMNVITGTAIGSFSSAIGEFFHLRKYFKDGDADSSADNILEDALGDTDEMDVTAIRDRVAEINSTATTDHPFIWDINSVDDVDFYDLDRIANKNNVCFKFADGTILSYDDLLNQKVKSTYFQPRGPLSASAIENKTLEQEILDTVAGKNYNEMETARKLYWELNRRVHYDVDYINVSQEMKNQIYEQVVTFDNLQDSGVICKGWSELYQQLLIDSGFDPDSVRIVGGDNIGSHKWVEIDLSNGTTLIADATETILGQTDLANAKAGSSTVGFIVKPQERGDDLFRISKEAKRPDANPDLLYSMDSWRDIDAKIGELESGSYATELIQQADEMFNTSMSSENIDNVFLNIIKNQDVPEGMDGLEYYSYLKKLNNQFYNGGGPRASYQFYKYGDSYDAMISLHFQDQYLLYSEKFGKLVTNYRTQAETYLRQLGFTDNQILSIIGG